MQYVEQTKNKYYLTINGEGVTHEGSLRALKTEKEVRRAAFEHKVTIDLDTIFGSSHTL